MIVDFCNNVGITDLGNNQVKDKCLSIVVKYFFRLSLDDIDKAFDLVILNRLDLNIDHYGRLTPAYISAILAAYSRLVRQRIGPKTALAAKKTDHNTQMREFLDQERNNFIKTGQLSIRNYAKVYEYLVEQKLLNIPEGVLSRIPAYVRKNFFQDALDTSSPIGQIFSQLKDEYKLDQAKYEYYIKRQKVIEQFNIWKNENKEC